MPVSQSICSSVSKNKNKNETCTRCGRDTSTPRTRFFVFWLVCFVFGHHCYHYQSLAIHFHRNRRSVGLWLISRFVITELASGSTHYHLYCALYLPVCHRQCRWLSSQDNDVGLNVLRCHDGIIIRNKSS